jgi:hypothetical protein
LQHVPIPRINHITTIIEHFSFTPSNCPEDDTGKGSSSAELGKNSYNLAKTFNFSPASFSAPPSQFLV